LAEELEQMTLRYESAAKFIPQSNTADLPPNDNCETQRQLVAQLNKYLHSDRNFAQPDIDTNELIRILATNRSYLYEAVKTITGKTLQEYINFLRLNEAKRLLETTNELVETIAATCGFNVPRTFYRQFREQYNISPAEYRKMGKEMG
jgi:AraC-like DNA-binding protein